MPYYKANNDMTNNHVHEWIPWENEPWFFTCKDENCPRVLDKLEVMERVNATEKLQELDAMLFVNYINDEFKDDPWLTWLASKLEGYAKARGD